MLFFDSTSPIATFPPPNVPCPPSNLISPPTPWDESPLVMATAPPATTSEFPALATIEPPKPSPNDDPTEISKLDEIALESPEDRLILPAE